MNVIRNVIRKLWFVGVLLSSASIARPDITLEGAIKLAASPAPRPAPARYQARVTEPAKPEPTPAVVYLEGNFAPATSAPTNTAPRMERIGQRNLRFFPRILPVQVGTRVEFPNLDDEYHNVLSYSRAKEFDLGRYRKDEKAPSVLFDKPGVVELDCEIHTHMRATILVLATPYFTTTDAAGNFSLTGLPPGKFILKAWLNPKTVLEQPVELKEGPPLQIHFSSP